MVLFYNHPRGKIAPLTKIVLPLYLVCLFCYILFTRQPDYFDSEFAQATMVNWPDTSNGKPVLMAEYSDGYKLHHIKVDYLFRDHQLGEKLTIVYEPKNPELAQEYAIMGYWMGWGELIWSLLLLGLSWGVAVSVTQNPTPEALLEQLNYKEPDKPRYD